jgi:hypothetical protein
MAMWVVSGLKTRKYKDGKTTMDNKAASNAASRKRLRGGRVSTTTITKNSAKKMVEARTSNKNPGFPRI